ncbi:MAG: SLBB domain-containing protein [Ignavibacteriaceae bacterium]|nr:SLBB domain-containing protein [Ignavibacteriaceae bacterium]
MKRLFFSLIAILCLSQVLISQSQDNQERPPNTAVTFPVTIGGDFLITGTFQSYPGERLDQFVTRMYIQSQENIIARSYDIESRLEAIETIDKAPLRGIKLLRADGSKLDIDLLKFRNTGDFKHNPYLERDDILIFPPVNLKTNSIEVIGGVMKPGIYPYMDGDNIKTMTELSQGLNPAFGEITDAIIYRRSLDGYSIEEIKVDINSSISLKPGDKLKIGSQTPLFENYKVLVLGDVKNPGYVFIPKNGVSILKALEGAGGVNEFSDIRNLKVFRSQNFPPGYLKDKYRIDFNDKKPVVENTDNKAVAVNIIEDIISLEYLSFLRMSPFNEEDTAYFMLETRLQTLLNAQVFNSSEKNTFSSELANYTVEHGDIIIVPALDPNINIMGQVAYPGKYKFVPGDDIKTYIMKAGGFGKHAIQDEIMIVKGTTREWINPREDSYTLEPGDYIYIPRETIRSFSWYVGQVAYYLGIVGNIATLIILLLSVNK